MEAGQEGGSQGRQEEGGVRPHDDPRRYLDGAEIWILKTSLTRNGARSVHTSLINVSRHGIQPEARM